MTCRRLILAAVGLAAVASVARAQELSPRESAAVTGETMAPNARHCPVPNDIAAVAPPAAHPGRCFAQVRGAPAYARYSERVMVTPGRREPRAIPAVYEWAERQVLVAPARVEHRVIPATYRTVNETVVVRPATTRIEHTEDMYETVTEQVIRRPAHSEWRRTLVGPDGVIPDGAQVEPTGEVICLIAVPADYATVQRRVLREPGHDVVVRIPAATRQVSRQVIDCPERVQDALVPAVYRTERYRRLVAAARTAWVDVPPVYATRMGRRQTSAGRPEWRKVGCDPKLKETRPQE